MPPSIKIIQTHILPPTQQFHGRIWSYRLIWIKTVCTGSSSIFFFGNSKICESTYLSMLLKYSFLKRLVNKIEHRHGGMKIVYELLWEHLHNITSDGKAQGKSQILTTPSRPSVVRPGSHSKLHLSHTGLSATPHMAGQAPAPGPLQSLSLLPLPQTHTQLIPPLPSSLGSNVPSSVRPRLSLLFQNFHPSLQPSIARHPHSAPHFPGAFLIF